MNAPPSHDWTSIPEILDTSAAWLAYTRGKRFCKDRLVGRICGLCCDQAGGVFELRVLSEAAPDLVPDFWDFRHGQSSYEMIDCLSRLTTKRVTSGRE
jgi:hypothetical protein